ncbi:MAG: Gfo/Idh/MocA family oxidoreductase [Nanoarchaeota archaeon]|nr:Gfo/Idh/MocA family oxidoreductase [DPANN group archaeon]MBL7116681.1 Gfo/Idh/MocA family oxidoreductase [Nanoarchaeota archaeon]
MKIGIIGLGSIGQRHARNLIKLDIEVYALRTKKGTMKELPEELNSIKEVFDEKEFFSLKLDGVIISNPTSLHISTLKKTLEKELTVFVEKPVSNSLEQTDELKGLDVSKVMVGYNLRYNIIIKTVKKFIDEGKIGKIYKANLYCGQYLPTWHPYADYRKEYYSKKSLGGGVIRTLSHEIDLANYLFGRINEVCGVVEKISDLKIDVDDHAIILFKSEDNVTGQIELDYLNPKLSRTGVIIGSKGKIEYDFSEAKVSFTTLESEEKVLLKGGVNDWEKNYLDEMKGFVDFIKRRKTIQCSFEEGVEVMRIIEAAEESTKSKKWIKIS